MYSLSTEQLAAMLQQDYQGESIIFTGLSTDTRSLNPGDLFVALTGDNYNANEFLHKAATAGAAGLVVEQRDPKVLLPQFLVEDCYRALGVIAQGLRQQFSGKLVGITGSSGKTTVKEMLASILSLAAPTHATRGNLNNHIGVPLTLTQLEDGDQFAVIEMGASGAGEISYLTAISQPDVVLVNNVMAAHLQGFGDLDGVAMAKGEIYQSLHQDGRAVINLDEPYAEQWSAGLSESQILRYSIHNNSAEVFAKSIDHGRGLYSFDLHTPIGTESIKLKVPGEHNVANALAAAACALACGVGLALIKQGLEAAAMVKGRLQYLRGLCASTIVDDSYNANPGSVCAAMDILAQCQGRKIFVLGEMGELGDSAKKLHKQVGKHAQLLGLDQLLCLGDLTSYAVKTCDNAKQFENKEELVAYIKPLLDKQTTVLVKGSRYMAMETVVQALLPTKTNDEVTG